MEPSLSVSEFGRMPDGESVQAWTLLGQGGLQIEVLTYGGIVRSILAPDRAGELADVVLGYNTLEGYINDAAFMGATAGRVAGRITKGRFTIDGKAYDLPINDEPNHLHGGSDALNRKVWKAEPVEREDGAPSIRLSCESPDGEMGYPGNASFEVTYTVTAENEFIYETRATVDQTCPISLTHHSYFNLAGEGVGTINDHKMRVVSDFIAAADEKMGLLNQKVSVQGNAADLRETVRLGDVVPDLWQRHGDLYWLGETDEVRFIGRIEEPDSGRVLEVSTDCTCLQSYFGEGFDGTYGGKSDRKYQQFGGFCMECEGYPDAVNTTEFGNILVHPGEEQCSVTIYKFSTSS